MEPFCTNVSEARAYWTLNELLTVLASAEQTGGSFALVEELLNKAAEPPPHVHHREDESFFVLSGKLTVRVGDSVFDAKPGAFVFCPRDIPHVLTVESTEVRMLTLLTPGGVERMFVDLGEPAKARTLPPEPAEPDLERVATLATHYGAEVLTDWPPP
jgi:quercetin dioxygenase-like cupin family protein